ncbi:MAG: helix-turn-helix transcriptional regulator [Gemmatimonadaceae bacterium]|nr:helix-turn-helix transcriptional regulator [Gemmatimonadaceae bacterium]
MPDILETVAPEASDRASRAPQQERGQRRVEQILDASEQVFAELGVDAATMQLIAERAESSMGSLYHFFPNKDAIVEALGARYAEAVRRANEEAMPLTLAHIELKDLFDRVLRAQMRLLEELPAFNPVHQAVQRNCPEINADMEQALVGHVGQFLALRYPRMPEDVRAASALVSVVAVHAVVELAGRLPSAHRALAIREAHGMMVSHYAAHDARYGSV